MGWPAAAQGFRRTDPLSLAGICEHTAGRGMVAAAGSVKMTNSTFDPQRCIDLARFPVHDLESAEGRRFLVRCQAELDETGACNLDGFLRPDAAAAMAREAVALQ